MIAFSIDAQTLLSSLDGKYGSTVASLDSPVWTSWSSFDFSAFFLTNTCKRSTVSMEFTDLIPNLGQFTGSIPKLTQRQKVKTFWDHYYAQNDVLLELYTDTVNEYKKMKSREIVILALLHMVYLQFPLYTKFVVFLCFLS